MRLNSIGLALALGLWSVASALAAEAVVEFEDGTPATPGELSRRVQESLKRPVHACPCWVVSDGYQPLRRPTAGATTNGAPNATSGAPAFRFMEMTSVLYTTQISNASEGQYHLLASGRWGTANLKILGWVPEARVLTRSTCESDPASGVKLKGLVVNSRRYLKSQSSGSKSFDLAKILLSPDESAREEKTFRFFNFYFVWKDTNPASDDQGYVLLGEQPSFNQNNIETSGREETIRESGMQGWVHKSRVCLWRTREAFKWNDRETDRQPVWAFADEKRALRNQRIPNEDAEEQFDSGRPIAWEHDRMRYPLISFLDKDGRTINSVAAEGNRLFKIGLIGDVVDENNRIVVVQSRMREMQDKLAALRAQLQKIEILFVVDDTTSMRRWFRPAADAVQRIADRASASGTEVRAAISFYHDIPNDDRSNRANLVKAVKTMRLADPTTPAFKLQLQRIRSMDESNGFDKREQLFLGLELSLSDFTLVGSENIPGAGFTPSGPRKMVVLIGDDGNHELGEAGEAKAIDRIVDKLCPAKGTQTPIEFLALQVAPADDEHRLAFKRQVEAIGERFNERVRPLDPEAAKRKRYYPVASVAELLDEIDQRYDELKKRANDLNDVVARLQQGDIRPEDLRDTGDSGRKTSPRKSQTRFRDPELQQLLGTMHLKLEDLAQAAEGVQVFDYHFVFENGKARSSDAPVPQVRKQVLLGGGELKNQVVPHLAEFFQEGGGPLPTLKDLADRIAKAQVGEAERRKRTESDARKGSFCDGTTLAGGDGTSIGGLLAVRYGIAFQSPLLKDRLKPADSEDAEAENRQLIAEIKKKLALLEDILEGNRYEYVAAFPDDDARLKRGNLIGLPGKSSRKFIRGSTAFFWYWIDYEDEWP